MTKKKIFFLALVFALISTNANAFFFFFLPGSVTGKIGDALTGSEGENCVGEKAKVGDVLTSASGNTAIIKSLSGTWSRCLSPELPIRALLTFSYSFSSKAGIDIPDGYDQKPLTDTQRFQGGLVSAVNSAKKTGIYVSTRKRDSKTDTAAVARAISDSMAKAVTDVKTANEETIKINGMRALRFELTGKNKGLFGRTFTYMVTLLEGDQELLVVNAWAPVEDYGSEKDGLRQLSLSIKGLNSNTAPTPPALVEVGNGISHNPPTSSTIPVPTPTVSAVITAGSNPVTSTVEGVANKLRELDKLYKEGVINQKEYDGKKQELLKAI